MCDPLEPFLPSHLHDLLRAPVVSTPAARARIVQQIRTLPSPRRLRAPLAGSRWSRRGLLSPVGGLFTTALLLCTLLLRTSPLRTLLVDPVQQVETVTLILGDSVVPASVAPVFTIPGFGASGVGASGFGAPAFRARGSVAPGHDAAVVHTRDDSLAARVNGYAQRVLDTLRIVEFVLRGSSVRTATVLGSFNAWNRGATPLEATGRDEWRARVLVPRDALATSLNVAFLVNGTKLISAAGGTARSLVYPN